MDGVGSELWSLVHHLYNVKLTAPLALEELCLRTNEKYDAGDAAMAPVAREIVYTRWYGSMKSRFKLLREQLAASKQAKEVDEVVESLFPQGTRVTQLGEAFVSVAALLTTAIDDALVAETARNRIQFYSSGKSNVSAKEIARDFVSGPLITTLIPPLWWLPTGKGQPSSTTGSTTQLAALRRIGLIVKPPTVVLQYTKQGHKKRRTIRLDGVLNPSTPLTTLVKKLRKSHASLLSDDEVRRLLLQLQRMMKEDLAQLGGSTSSAANPSTTAPTSYAQQAAPPSSSAKNKADLGLLYRDPEAALQDVDLQDADDFTVKEFKARMNEKFVQNVVKPGDPGYAYDKRVAINPTAKSEWDDE